MGYKDVVGLQDPPDGLRSTLNARYSHFSNRRWVPVRCVSFSRSVNVSSNKVSVVAVFVKNTFKVSVSSSKSGVSQTSCARLVKVFIVVALCEVGL